MKQDRIFTSRVEVSRLHQVRRHLRPILGREIEKLDRALSELGDPAPKHRVVHQGADRLAELQSKYANQIKVYTPANTYYFFMNNRLKPFSDVRVRLEQYFLDNRRYDDGAGGCGCGGAAHRLEAQAASFRIRAC